jgi:predicted nucleic acid-binding protein
MMSGGLLFDTCVLIDCLRGHAPSRKLIETSFAGKIRPSLSVIAVMELHAGALMDNPSIADTTNALIQEFSVLPVSETIAAAAGLLLRKHRSSGLAPMDALVAATAIESGSVLATRNVKHFRILPNLIVLDVPLD